VSFKNVKEKAVGDVVQFRPRLATAHPDTKKRVNKVKQVLGVEVTEDRDLSERIDRIKTSLARINQLMSELRNMDDDKPNHLKSVKE
jgi:hypothetical protein